MNLEFFFQPPDTAPTRARLGLELSPVDAPTTTSRPSAAPDTAQTPESTALPAPSASEPREETKGTGKPRPPRHDIPARPEFPFSLRLLAASIAFVVALVPLLSVSPAVAVGQGSSLDANAIRDVAKSNQEGIARCYDEALRFDPLTEGRVMLDFQVASSGLVEGVQIAYSELDDTVFLDCLTASASTWIFPPTGNGAVRISYPFEFEPDLPDAAETGTLAAQTLAASAFRARLRDHEGVKACYHYELKQKSDNVAGRLVVEFVIDGDGVVASAETVESTLSNLRLEGCVLDEMSQVRFPSFAGKGTTVVSYPFMFKPAP